jgi:hypothetical protein
LLLTIDQAEFIKKPYNYKIANALVSYLGMYGEITPEKKAFAEWAIGYLYENRFTLNFDDFDNQIVTRYDVAQAFAQYTATNNIFELDNKNFLDWAVGYLIDFPAADFDELISNNNIPNSTINLPTLDVSELGNYPVFKNLVENLPNFLNSYPNILKALEYTSGFSPKKIKELMQPGKGPKVVVINNLKDKDGYDIFGHSDSVSRVLQIDNGYVNGLSVVNNQFRYQAIGLMLTITTLHEFVHYGRDINNLPNLIKDLSGKKEREAGWYFERSIDYNNIGDLQPETAKQWLKYYKVKPKR